MTVTRAYGLNEAIPLAHGFRSARSRDLNWLLDLRMQTMAGYIEASGRSLSIGEQLDRILQDFDSIQIITSQDRDIGMMKVVREPEHWKLVQIQLLPAYQGYGLGTRILDDLIREASSQTASLSLNVLKVNPAKRLYDRLGFHVTGESASSYEMRIDA